MKHGYIYKITIGPNYYFGRTVKRVQRKSAHLSLLKRGMHDNSRMQRAYNKYGSYTFEIVEKVPVDKLPSAEFEYVSSHIKDKRCMNLQVPDPNDSHSFNVAAETREKIKNARKKQDVSVQVKAMRKANLRREYDRKQIEAATKAKYKPCVLISPKGKRYRFESVNAAAEFLGVPHTTLGNCLRGHMPWPTIKPGQPGRPSRFSGWTGEFLT